MKRILLSAILLLMLPTVLPAQTATDTDVLTQLLKEFLDGASRSDPRVHDRFWAEDLIYTRSSGRRVGKAEVMRDVRSAPAPKPGDPTTRYSAEDIRIQQYGNTAVVAFRLVGATERSGRTEVANYLNTGTFLKRNSIWQVVSWQATRMPRLEEEAREEVAPFLAAFHQALLAADGKALESLTDESFIWTLNGEQVPKRHLPEALKAGQLKQLKPEIDSCVISIYGDTVVVRGVAKQQLISVSGPPVQSAGNSSSTSYTLIVVNKDGGWKAVGLHTSRP